MRLLGRELATKAEAKSRQIDCTCGLVKCADNQAISQFWRERIHVSNDEAVCQTSQFDVLVCVLKIAGCQWTSVEVSGRETGLSSCSYSGLQASLKPADLCRRISGAGNEVRTRDLNLGTVTLYQLSYSR